MGSDMVAYDMRSYINKNGIRSAQIFADTAFYFEDSTAVPLVGVRMEVYTEPGAVRATVTAERGRYDSASQGMHAQGNVVLVIPEGIRRVESPELYYEPMDERIWSDSATTYHKDRQVTRGSCFKSNLSFTNFTVCNIRGSADVGG